MIEVREMSKIRGIKDICEIRENRGVWEIRGKLSKISWHM
jgi:hypothetical protein